VQGAWPWSERMYRSYWCSGTRRITRQSWRMARSGNGPLCFWQGKRYQLRESEPGPFMGRADASVVLKGISDLMTMPSAGDLVIYGIDAPHGHVSFIPEMGAHAGPSPNELNTFIVRPPKVTLPSPISHPIQLYDHFIRYQEPS